MAEPQAAQRGRDLASIAEARGLAPRAKPGWVELAEFSQARIDDMRVVFSEPDVGVQGLYSSLTPELNQPASSAPRERVRADRSNFGRFVGARRDARPTHLSSARRHG